MFIKTWARTQHSYLQRNHLPHDKNQARTGMLQIGLLLVKIPKKIWDLRNHGCHAPPAREVPGYRRLMLLSKVEHLYEFEPHVLSFDKETFFSVPFSERQTHSNQQLQSYIDFYKTLIQDSVKQASDMGANFRPIYDYFRINPENPPEYIPDPEDIIEIAP